MANQTEQVQFIVTAIESGFDKVVQKLDRVETQTKKVTKATKRGGQQFDNYGRKMRGAADMSSNATKNFSKMQQNIEGGGSGGLVRAYALLAANVFALSAAFGILSRAAQVDTLIASMEQLEIVSGKSIRGVARDLQEASGFGMDFANSLRSTSLALSAGFENKQIMELGEVARNAAVSLGRNLPDALDRIFRGVIKVEPELLDEIGLFVRVNEAASKYASSLGVSVGSLTEFQRRQAFANEAIEQGQNKFEAFADVPIDPFAKLATTFSDITQNVLTFLNKGLGPIVNFISENKIIFGQIFLAVGTVLLRMVIPAMGQFTLQVAANAEAQREAAAEAVTQSEMKISQLRQESVELEKLKRAKLEAELADKKLKDKPVQLKVRGRAKSRDLENALQKELSIENRKRVVTQRIADLTEKRGRKQREQNEQAQKELQILREELRIIKQIEASEERIQGGGREISMKDNQLAAQVQRAAQKSLIKADAIAGVVATAELEGMRAGFGAVGDSIAVAGAKAQAAGIKFGIFDKILLGLQGTAGVVAVKIQSLMMTFMPFITAIMIAIPILTMIAKAIGFFGEAQGKLKEANSEASESLEMFTKKLDHANEQLQKFRADKNFKGITDATLALKEATLSTIQSLEQQIAAFDEYRENTNFFVQVINAEVSDLFGDTAQQKIEDNIDDFIAELKRGGGELTEEMQKLVDKLQRREDFFFGIGTEGIRKEILERARIEAEGFKSIKSAIDGARDSAREFSDSLITKTQVDKPLASFKQINTNIKSTLLTEKERKELLDEIVNDNAVLALLTQDQKDTLEAAGEDTEKRLSVLKEVQLEFERQQELLIQQKGLLAEIKGLQDQIKGLLKFSVTAIEMQNTLLNERRAIELELLQREVDRKIAATGLTETRLRELSTMGSLVGREKELGLEVENIAQVHSALLAIRMLQVEESKEEMRLATESLRVENDKVKAALEFLKVDKALNDSLKSRVADQVRLQKAATGRGVGGDFGTTIEKIAKEEELRNKNAQERIDAEIAVAQFQFLLAKEELEVIKERQKVENERQRNIVNEQNALLLSGTLTPDQEAIAEARRNAAVGNFQTGRQTVTKIEGTIDNLEKAADQVGDTIISKFEAGGEKAGVALLTAFDSAFKTSDLGVTGFDNLFNMQSAGTAIQEILDLGLTDDNGDPLFTREMLQMQLFESQILHFAEKMESVFGEDGRLIGAIGKFSAAILNISTNFAAALEDLPEDNVLTKTFNEETAGRVEAVATAVSAGLSGLSSVFSAYMQNNIKEVDNLIEAEKKRDGKSKESLAKIAALEKKKEAMKRKEFETNKKIMLAQAIASTAAGVAGALAQSAVLGPFAIPLAVMIGAMGAAQVALISKLKFNGGTTQTETPTTNLQIGQRSNAVDVSQRATAGELNYLRGGRTTGQDLGGAGGAMGRKGYSMGFRQGYADGGIVVGERGPEVITPSTDVDIVPNFALGGGETNVNFTINAVDAAGVEDVLSNQRGNIIRMIREAANENGERFLETVDTQTYGSSV